VQVADGLEIDCHSDLVNSETIPRLVVQLRSILYMYCWWWWMMLITTIT